MEKVCCQRLSGYEPTAVRGALEAVLGPVLAHRGGVAGKRVMIKPNFLEYRKPDDPACVHPVMLTGLCAFLRDAGAAELAVIENPAVRTAPAIAAAMGVTETLASLGVRVANCSRYERTAMPETCLFKQLEVAAEFREYDWVIDFAKAKTHAMMTLTLAVKNLFGLIRGSERLGWHLAVGRDYDKFADLLLDLYTLVRPQISLLDAVIGMEGNGPGSGDPVRLGFVAAATDALALDASAAELLGAPDIPVLTRARARGMMPEFEICGDVPEIHPVVLPEPPAPTLAWGVWFPVKLRDFLRRRMVARPVLDAAKCVGCGLCAAKCPPRTLKMRSGKPKFDYPGCIRCYCCQEYCPQGAITSGKTWLMRLADGLEKLLRRGRTGD